MKKRFLLLLSLLLLLQGLALGEELPFAVRYGSRQSRKIAITVDDGFDLPFVWKIRDLFHETGIRGTFFPVGAVLKEEDRAEWQKVLDYGSEIGSHNFGHNRIGNSPYRTIIGNMARFQEALDKTLGYHYQVQAFRPPFGCLKDEKGSNRTVVNAILAYGYDHVILWDVSQTDPEKAIWAVQNGSILLFHARYKDHECLKKLIPMLLEKGFEPVTVSELLGFGPNEISSELYVYNPADFEKK